MPDEHDGCELDLGRGGTAPSGRRRYRRPLPPHVQSPRFAQQSHQMVRPHDIEEAAAPNAATASPIAAKPRPKRWCRSGADEGEGAPEHAALQRNDQDNGERPEPDAAPPASGRSIEQPARFSGRATSGRARDDGEQGDGRLRCRWRPAPRRPSAAQPVADRAASAAPVIRPRVWPLRKRASVAWRRS